MVWLVIWLAAWVWSKRARRREGFATGIWHTLAFVAACVLVSTHGHGANLLYAPVVAYVRPFDAVGLALTVAGLAYSVWARFFPGNNWSAGVQVKDRHQLVRSGPYRVVRHP
jgi:protein-S-isoprenylcysteine O-methyltransferase Ste14